MQPQCQCLKPQPFHIVGITIRNELPNYHPFHCQPLPLPLAAAPMVYIYESTATNNTYLFNTMPLNQSDAESYCQDSGGHLVSYAGADEQTEVEGYYIDKVKDGDGHCEGGCGCDFRRHSSHVVLTATINLAWHNMLVHV